MNIKQKSCRLLAKTATTNKLVDWYGIENNRDFTLDSYIRFQTL